MLVGRFKFHKHLLEIIRAHLLDVTFLRIISIFISNVFSFKGTVPASFPRYGCSIDKLFFSPILDFKSASCIQFLFKHMH